MKELVSKNAPMDIALDHQITSVNASWDGLGPIAIRTASATAIPPAIKASASAIDVRT